MVRLPTRSRGPTDEALIILDMQEWILSQPLAPASTAQLTTALRHALERWRESPGERPVVWVAYLRLDGSDGGLSGDARISEGLDPRPGDPLITKFGIDAFAGTRLQQTLNDLGVGRLTLAGVATDQAVLQTALTAVKLGYEVSVVPSLCTTTSIAAHTAALDLMREVGVRLVELPTDLPAL